MVQERGETSTSNCPLLRGDVYKPLSAKPLFIAKIFALRCLLSTLGAKCLCVVGTTRSAREEPKLRARRATPNRNGDNPSQTSNTTRAVPHVLQGSPWFWEHSRTDIIKESERL